MLSRVADSLYWTSRYLERAEHTARLIDINMGLMLDDRGSSAERRWQRVLAALGAAGAGLAGEGDGNEPGRWVGVTALVHALASIHASIDHGLHYCGAGECAANARRDQHGTMAAP